MLDFSGEDLPPCAYVRADYTEGKPETFSGYTVDIGGGPVGRHSDLNSAIRHAENIAAQYMVMSSVDNYRADSRG